MKEFERNNLGSIDDEENEGDIKKEGEMNLKKEEEHKKMRRIIDSALRRFKEADHLRKSGDEKRASEKDREGLMILRGEKMEEGWEMEELTCERISKLLRVPSRTVRDWVERGFLKTTDKFGRGKGWKIDPREFKNFVEKEYPRFDPSQVTDRILREILDNTPAAKAIPTSWAAKVLNISVGEVGMRANEGKLPVAYRGYKPGGGHDRWYVEVPASTFKWFQDLADNDNNRAVEWLIESIKSRDLLMLNILLIYEPKRIEWIRQRIRCAPIANRIVQEFERTSEGERLKNVCWKPNL